MLVILVAVPEETGKVPEVPNVCPSTGLARNISTVNCQTSQVRVKGSLDHYPKTQTAHGVTAL
jgi:hypothetical protein